MIKKSQCDEIWRLAQLCKQKNTTGVFDEPGFALVVDQIKNSISFLDAESKFPLKEDFAQHLASELVNHSVIKTPLAVFNVLDVEVRYEVAELTNQAARVE